MLLKSDSFGEGAVIPGDFAFAVPDLEGARRKLEPESQSASGLERCAGGDEVVRADLPRLRCAQPW